MIGKLRKIYVGVNILGNNFGVHATSFEVTCFLVPSTVTVSANTFPTFCHLASRLKAPKEIICISCYSSNNSYLEILSWLLLQAKSSNLSLLQCFLLRKQVAACISLSLFNISPCGFSRALSWLSTQYSFRKVNCKCSLSIRNSAFKNLFQRLLQSWISALICSCTLTCLVISSFVCSSWNCSMHDYASIFLPFQ